MSIIHAYDVVVVGGGPAGMMAAGQAASRGLRVCILEKNAVLGTKLSITGGGRCNITNAEFDVRTLLAHYGDAEPFLYAPFAQFGVQQTFDFFESLGLPCIIEESKRAFPHTEKAIDVTRVMEEFVHTSGALVHTSTPVRSIKVSKGAVAGLVTDRGVYTARSYVIACGGTSRPETGSTGEGMTWLTSLGHTVHTPNPDLVPLVVHDAWVKSLSGTTLIDIGITFTLGGTKIRKIGNVLCTHFGLSGPLILNVAHQVKGLLTHGPINATIDLFPHDDVGMLRKKLTNICSMNPNKTVENAPLSILQKGVTDAVFAAFPTTLRTSKVHSITKETRFALVERMKNLPLTVIGTKGLAWAIVSDGGVDLREIDTRTMQSKIHSNLFIVGDMLNVRRPSGGYSLQLCWTTGWVAGNNVARTTKSGIDRDI